METNWWFTELVNPFTNFRKSFWFTNISKSVYSMVLVNSIIDIGKSKCRHIPDIRKCGDLPISIVPFTDTRKYFLLRSIYCMILVNWITNIGKSKQYHLYPNIWKCGDLLISDFIYQHWEIILINRAISWNQPVYWYWKIKYDWQI